MKKKRIALIGFVTLLVLLSILIYNMVLKRSPVNNSYSGTIEATEIPVQPETGGRIIALLVQEGQDVKTGDIIAQLDDSQAQISLAAAKSQLTQAQARLDDLLNGARGEEIRQLQNVVKQAQANADGLTTNKQYEEKNLADLQQLFAGGATSQQAVAAQQNKLTTLNAQLDAALAGVQAAQAALELALSGVTQPAIQIQKAAVDIASQSVKSAELALSKLTVKSPVNGRVLYQHIETGQVVNAGTSLVTMIDPANLWVKVYVPESKLNQVTIGAAVSVTVDAYPDRSFTGTVLYTGDKAEFTPKNVQTKEERTTTVFTVKIGITEGKDQLKAGMPADVTLL